jgi:hypothetical protein
VGCIREGQFSDTDRRSRYRGKTGVSIDADETTAWDEEHPRGQASPGPAQSGTHRRDNAPVSEPKLDRRVVHVFTDLEGDEPRNLQPELHLIGLSGDDVVAVFKHLNRRGARWNDRAFYLDGEGIDVTVSEQPDVAEVVVSGQVSHACVGADGIGLDGAELPTLSMFIYPDSIEFFWETGPPWREDHVPVFLAIMRELLDLAPNASLARTRPLSTNTARRSATPSGDPIASTTGIHCIPAARPGGFSSPDSKSRGSCVAPSVGEADRRTQSESAAVNASAKSAMLPQWLAPIATETASP